MKDNSDSKVFKLSLKRVFRYNLKALMYLFLSVVISLVVDDTVFTCILGAMVLLFFISPQLLILLNYLKNGRKVTVIVDGNKTEVIDLQQGLSLTLADTDHITIYRTFSGYRSLPWDAHYYFDLVSSRGNIRVPCYVLEQFDFNRKGSKVKTEVRTRLIPLI